MGLLVDGKWQDRWYDTDSTGGRFVRKASQFRDFVTADGSSGFPAEAGRYHLYVSYACPWAHRTLIFRKLKELERAISVTVVDPLMFENGWEFSSEDPDPVAGYDYLSQVYTAARSDYTGRVTVPVLWDRKRETIVNNESSEIIRILNSEFDQIGNANVDFAPADRLDEIDEINDFVYDCVNNGVYRCGFATTQKAYEEAFEALFGALDELDHRLSTRRYLLGEILTEADWRLFTTLVRFDAVYVGHFKCNRQRIADCRNLSGYLRELYQVPGVRETVHFDHIKNHYYQSHTSINPTRVVPLGPELDLESSHGRDQLAGAPWRPEPESAAPIRQTAAP